MKLTPRELALAWLTGATVILGGTYLVLQPHYEQLKALSRNIAALEQRKTEAELTLSRRGDLENRLQAIRSQLPSHVPGQDVTAEYLRTLERLAQQNGLTLLRREAEPERQTGDIYEVSINCNWEGDLDSLVRFLYALQSQGAMLDVRQLTISPIPGGARLKGTFTVDFAFTRTAPAGTETGQQS